MNRFYDLAILCPDMVALESKKIERYIWGLSPKIQSSVLASKPVTFDSAKELAQSLIDHRKPQNPTIPTPVPQKVNNSKKGWYKRKRGASQESSKRQQLVAINAATVTPVVPANPLPSKTYAGTLPKCTKCSFHHHGPCKEMQCSNCNRKGAYSPFLQDSNSSGRLGS